MSAETTERRYLRSTLAAYGIQLSRLLINFAAKLILARLVLPEGHGVYELALRIVTVTAAVRDLGLPYQLMRDERRPYGTVFWSTLGLGIALTAGLALAAPAFAFLSPDLPAVLRVLALWIVLDGLAVVPRAFFERELAIGRLVAPEVWRTAVLAAVSVGLAAAGFGVWSFVAGDLAGALFLAAFLWLRARRRVPLAPRLALLPDLVRRSSYLFWIWIVLQLVTYIDVYIVGFFTDTATVGLYARAYMIAFLTATIVFPRALFPTLVECLGDAERFFVAFRVGVVQLLGLQVLASYFLLFNPERTVGILLGPGWERSIPLLAILAFAPLFEQFGLAAGELLKARHEDRLWLVAMLLNLLSLGGGGVFATSRWGALGMAVANYALLGNALIAWRIARVFGRRSAVLARDVIAILLVPLPFFGAAAWLLPAADWSRFAASGVAAALSLAALAALYQRPFRAFFGQR